MEKIIKNEKPRFEITVEELDQQAIAFCQQHNFKFAGWDLDIKPSTIDLDVFALEINERKQVERKQVATFNLKKFEAILEHLETIRNEER